jgi:addiction module RelB/DinJ family antitoxin
MTSDEIDAQIAASRAERQLWRRMKSFLNAEAYTGIFKADANRLNEAIVGIRRISHFIDDEAILRHSVFEATDMVASKKNTTYNIRLDARIRQEADELFRGIGLTLSQAVNLFLTQSVIKRKLPLTEIVAASDTRRGMKQNPNAVALLEEADAHFENVGRPSSDDVEESILQARRKVRAEKTRR